MNEPEPKTQFSPLEQFWREQEIAKAKIEAARAGLIIYFQRKLQALADDWRAADGVLNWQMPEFGQALSELKLSPLDEARPAAGNAKGRPRGRYADWEKPPCCPGAILRRAGRRASRQCAPKKFYTSSDLIGCPES